MAERITGDAWNQAFTTFQRSAFRLEIQGVYREPGEREPLERFLAGEEPDYSMMDDWVALIKAATSAGKSFRRVRTLTEPLTDYLRFELAFTDINVDAGEDIRLLPADRARVLDLPREDFWMFDDARVLSMHFDDNGFAYADLITDSSSLDRYREIRDIAWQNAIPFREYVTAR